MNTFDLTAFIQNNGGELVTDSRAVALAFGKRHSDVIRTINQMRNSLYPEIAEHHQRNFASVFYESKGANGATRKMPMYRMTQDGLTELAMGFIGDQARIVRIRFIAAFREVAARLESTDRSITQMLHDFSKRAAVSEAKGTMGSRLMHTRRKEKKTLDDEVTTLHSIAQPSLLN